MTCISQYQQRSIPSGHASGVDVASDAAQDSALWWTNMKPQRRWSVPTESRQLVSSAFRELKSSISLSSFRQSITCLSPGQRDYSEPSQASRRVRAQRRVGVGMTFFGLIGEYGAF